MTPKRWRDAVGGLRQKLITMEPDAMWLLALLGALSGLSAGLAIVALRLLIETAQRLLGNEPLENYEQLAAPWRLLLPSAGGLVLGLCLQRLARADRELGVAHVMSLLARRDGLMPLKNAAVQFLAAAFSIACGHSGGREGPSIHVGAACGSWMGQRLNVPNNNVRILVGCGAAGAIAAAFNTPLAGVIFTMEVLLAEYTLSSFIPIILAAVCGAAVSRWAFGAEPAFAVPNVALSSLADLVFVVLMGVLIGALSAGFVRLLGRCGRLLPRRPIAQRLTLAGVLTGLIALPLPQVMGIGYDTIEATLRGDIGLWLLLAVLAGKLAATALGLGLGLPGGVIGPTLVIGAIAGGALGALPDLLSVSASHPALFAMLGMGAMMSATLNAPLAALTALLELTNNPHIIMPGMLAIVAANLTCQHLFTTPSVFLQTLRTQGLNYRAGDPIAQYLRRLSVAGAMDRSVQTLTTMPSRAGLDELLKNPPDWLLLRDARPRPQLIFTADLVRHLQTGAGEESRDSAALDLPNLPVQRLAAAPASARETLLAALRQMNREEVDALYIVAPNGGRALGVITRRSIERRYRNPAL